MNTVNAVLHASYNDGEDKDVIPCLVDLDKGEVIEFYPAEEMYADSQIGNSGAEWFVLDDGTEYDAVSTFARDMMVDFGDWPYVDKSAIIVFDEQAAADAIYEAFGVRPECNYG